MEREVQAILNILIRKGILTEKEFKEECDKLLKEKQDYYKDDLDYHTY